MCIYLRVHSYVKQRSCKHHPQEFHRIELFCEWKDCRVTNSPYNISSVKNVSIVVLQMSHRYEHLCM